jgi:ArsR family transcriptional regulator
MSWMTKLERHADQFGALGHPARLEILRQIVRVGVDGITTTELQSKLDMPWTTLSHHLARLVSAGLVNAERDGKFAYHSADYTTLQSLMAFFWDDCCKAGKHSGN